MLIGIDANEANVEKRVGIGEYAFRLIEQLYKLRSNARKFDIYLKRQPSKDFPKEDEFWNYKIIGPRKMWTQIGLPVHLFLKPAKPDVFFTPSHYAPRFSPVPTVVSIMDLSYIYFPRMFNSRDLHQLTSWTKYSVDRAARIITISNSSKNAIIKEYKKQADQVEVTYLGIKAPQIKNVLNMQDLQKKFGIKKDYILFVGTLQPRKNIEKLIEAYSKLHTKVSLVIVGKKGWQYEEILSAPKKFHIEEKVKFVEFVSDEELSAFYKNALCFVLPSLYEGFGLPVLEAMQHGCPVLTSNISSLPEAGGDAALYFDPQDVEDMTQKINKVISDKGLRDEMIKKGYQQAKKFSWERAAKQTLSILEDVANER